jgi:enoyl-CoA hydratase
VAPHGRALEAARQLAAEIAAFPQRSLRADRRSVLNQWALSLDAATRAEYAGGAEAMASGEAREGAERFKGGSGRHGKV